MMFRDTNQKLSARTGLSWRLVSFCALFLLALLSGRPAQGANPPYLVYGYLGDWDGVTAAQMPWNSLTHVMDAFGLPDGSGGFTKTPNTAMITAAHTNGKKMLLSIGGASASIANWNANTNGTNINAFVTNIMNFVAANNYDGVDIDWEFPDATTKTQFMSLMQKLYSACTSSADPNWKGSAKELTFFISPGYYICGVDWTTIGNYCTYGILGGYDLQTTRSGMTFNGPINSAQTFTDCSGNSHSLSVKGTVDRINALGMPKNKIILALPLYQAPSAADVNTVICSGTGGTQFTPEDERQWNGGSEAVTDSWAFCQKMNWAAGYGLAGFGLWEIAYAVPTNQCTEISNIWSTLAGTTGCLTFLGTATPSVTASGTPSLTGTRTATRTATQTATSGSSATFTPSVTATASPSVTVSPTATSSATRTVTQSSTASPSATRSASPSATASASPSGTQTSTRTATQTITAGNSATFTPTLTPSASPTATRSASPSGTPSATGTASPSVSPSRTASSTATATQTASATPSASGTRTATASASPSATISPTPTETLVASDTASPTQSPVLSPTDSPSATASATPSGTATATRSATASVTPSGTASATASASPSASATATPSATRSASPSATATATPSSSPSATASQSASPSATESPVFSATATPTASPTLTQSPVFTPTATPSITQTQSPPPSATPSGTPTLSFTLTPSPTPSATDSPVVGPLPSFTATTLPSSGGPLLIEQAVVMPVPVMMGGIPPRLSWRLNGPADRLQWKLFTRAWVVCASGMIQGALPPGWDQTVLLLPGDLPSGSFYLELRAGRDGTQSDHKVVKMMVLR
jgi:hypothetical protein